MGQSPAAAIDWELGPAGLGCFDASCSVSCQLSEAGVGVASGPRSCRAGPSEPMERSVLLPGGGGLAHTHSSLETPFWEAVITTQTSKTRPVLDEVLRDSVCEPSI